MLGVGLDELDDVFSSAPVGIYVDHTERGCIYANDALLDMFGATFEEFSGFGWARRVHEDDAAGLRDAIHDFEHERGWIDVQYRVVHPDGSLRHIHARVKALLDAEGTHVGSFGSVRDLTLEREQREQSVQRQRLEAVGRLAGRVAHDFNNLLGLIVMTTSMLDEQPDEAERRKSVETILQASEHATAITRQLLGLSRQGVDERATVIVDTELRGLVPLVDQVIGESVDLRLDLGAGGAGIMLAPHELGQIIVNLCVNARDALAGPGTITIATRHVDSRVELVVKDTGPGIPVDVQERMFEPFFTTKGAGRGTGLGLSTVRDLVGRAGGEIRVRSELGSGTTLTIEVPRAAPPSASQRPGERRPVVDPLRVLLVDDNDALRQSVAYALALSGHEVTTAATIASALEQLSQQRFELVVTDVLLPDGEAPQLVSAARADDPNLPIVYITGFAGDAADALDRGPGTAYLPKPFGPDELAQAIAEAVRTAVEPEASQGKAG